MKGDNGREPRRDESGLRCNTDRIRADRRQGVRSCPKTATEGSNQCIDALLDDRERSVTSHRSNCSGSDFRVDRFLFVSVSVPTSVDDFRVDHFVLTPLQLPSRDYSSVKSLGGLQGRADDRLILSDRKNNLYGRAFCAVRGGVFDIMSSVAILVYD